MLIELLIYHGRACALWIAVEVIGQLLRILAYVRPPSLPPSHPPPSLPPSTVCVLRHKLK